MSHSVIPLVGANFARRTQTKEFALGTATIDNANRTWVYVHAAGTVATGARTVDSSFELTSTAGTYTADTAFAAGDYGWVRKTTSPL